MQEKLEKIYTRLIFFSSKLQHWADATSGNGQNLWQGYGHCSGQNCVSKAIQDWIGENNSGKCPNKYGGQSCGHWSQIIWQNTKKVSAT